MTNVCCVNVGTKYSVEYTLRLYNMVKRNTSKPFEFYVYTDQTERYNKYDDIIAIEHDNDDFGWWCKLHLFKDGVLPKGEYLYFDLDVVIVDNIDELFDHKGFGIIRDFIRPDEGIVGGKEYNSSIVKFDNRTTNGIYIHYRNNKQYWMELRKQIGIIGDQNVVSSYCNYYPDFVKPFQDEIIWSFKKGVERGKHYGDRSQWFGRKILKGGKVCVFHGDPSPREILNDEEKYLSMGNKFCTNDTINWIKNNWK